MKGTQHLYRPRLRIPISIRRRFAFTSMKPFRVLSERKHYSTNPRAWRSYYKCVNDIHYPAQDFCAYMSSSSAMFCHRRPADDRDGQAR